MALQTAGLVDEALKGTNGSNGFNEMTDRGTITISRTALNKIKLIQIVLRHRNRSSTQLFNLTRYRILESMWKVVEPAIDFVVDMQTERGEIIWARHSDGTLWSYTSNRVIQYCPLNKERYQNSN